MHSLLNHVRVGLAHTASHGRTHFRRLCFLMLALLLMATQFAAPTSRSLALAPAEPPTAAKRVANAQSAVGLPDIATLESAGTGGGWANDVVVEGTTAYLFESNKLIILDIQNPAAPKWLGEYRFEPEMEGLVQMHMDVAGAYVYVADPTSGLKIIDVSNPQQPSLCGEYTGLSHTYDVNIIDMIAYVVGEHFHILDLHNPCAPTLLGSAPGWATNVVVSNGRAYLETQFDGITIIDVSNPTAPVKLGTYADGGSDLAVVGTRLYIARDGLLIVDVSNPTAPTLLQKYQALGGLMSVDVVGSLAYVGANNRLGIIDVSEPTAPILLGSYAPLNEIVSAIQVSGSFAYVAAAADDLQIIDIRNPASPQRYGSYITIKNPYLVHVEGALAYIGGSRLDILNVSDLHNPKLIGAYQPASYIGALEIADNLAYLAGELEFEIVDIHNPAQPTLLGRYSVPSDSSGFGSVISHIDVVGTHAYLSLKGNLPDNLNIHTHGRHGLIVLDISNPAAPQLVASYTTTTPVLDLQVVGTRAYLALGHDSLIDLPSGLLILDVADPAHPTLVGTYQINGIDGSSKDLQVVGDIVYLLQEREGLNILDVSDPASPRRIGLFARTEGYPLMALEVDGPVAYLMADDIEVLNVSDPTRPTLHSIFSATRLVRDMQMADDHLYTVNGKELSVYHVERDQASAEIAPSGGSLVNQIKTVEMTVPPDAVGTTAVVSYTGFLAQTQPLTEDQRIIRSFAIDAGQQSDIQLADFAQPYTIELRYNQLQLAAALAQENTLAVAVRNGDAWTDLPATSYTVDTANDRVILTGTQAREYALVGRSAHTFLPLMSH